LAGAEAAAYLAKSRESLAAEEADADAGRYNAAASRAYYAAFQAVVALLLAEGIKPRGRAWEHRYVIAQFSGTLVRRRKLIPSRFRGAMQELLDLRSQADYDWRSVSRRRADRALADVKGIVDAVARQLRGD